MRCPNLPAAPFGRDSSKPSGIHNCSASSTISDASHRDSAVTTCKRIWYERGKMPYAMCIIWSDNFSAYVRAFSWYLCQQQVVAACSNTYCQCTTTHLSKWEHYGEYQLKPSSLTSQFTFCKHSNEVDNITTAYYAHTHTTNQLSYLLNLGISASHSISSVDVSIWQSHSKTMQYSRLRILVLPVVAYLDGGSQPEISHHYAKFILILCEVTYVLSQFNCIFRILY